MHFKYGEPEKISRAKQRASVSWIIQKAHKNKVPGEFQDPYYKDYEGQEHLKPNIVHRLANADFYCSALANIYGDPNFHNLSHWNIIQALARKGVYVAEPTDIALTETVLIQTTPLKMSAHLAVIEAMMALYIREVVIAERVVQAIQRIAGSGAELSTPQDQEEALVLWIDHAARNLQDRIHQQEQQQLPVFPKIQDLSDLIDGIGLTALISYYCPLELPWEDIAVADPPSMADSLYNISLVIRFCQESLPYNPCLLTKEDIVYMHSSVKQNILGFVAELFFLLELEPVSAVSVSTLRRTSTKYIQLSTPGIRTAGAPSVRRSHSMNLNDVGDSRSRVESRSENAPSSINSDYGGRESSMSDGQEEFVVQKAKSYATLNDMMRTQSPYQPDTSHGLQDSRAMAKERYNADTKEEELGERGGGLIRRGSFHDSSQELNLVPAAGLPSRNDGRLYGRSRSRRNSINADESQLTIENFGGSQDNLNYVGRNPDKEVYVHTGKRDSLVSNDERRRSSSQNRERSVERRRSSSQNRERSVERRIDLHRPSMDDLDNKVVDKLERESIEKEKRGNRNVDYRRHTNEYVDSSSESDASGDPDRNQNKATSFAELSKIKDSLPGGINIIYMQTDRDEPNPKMQLKTTEKKTTFAALPNQTTWKQQSVQSQDHVGDSKHVMDDDNMEPQVMSSELHNVRLKLEEKRRRIEAEKRKVEMMMNKQRQKLGKEAFMQAVVKGGKGVSSTGSSTPTTASEPDPTDSLMDNLGRQPSISPTSPTSPLQSKSSLPQLPPSASSQKSVTSPKGSHTPCSSSQTGTIPAITRPNTIFTLKDLGTEVTNVSKKWLEGSAPEELRTPDIDAMDYDEYQNSLTQMTDSLTDIQSDIQRLTHQQNQIQSLMHNGMAPPSSMPSQAQNQFYLHDQQGSPTRRMWGQPQGSEGYSSMSPATRRSQWGPPARPMIPQGDYMMGGPQQPPGYYPYQMPRPMGQPTHQLPPINQMGPPPPSQVGFMLHGQPHSLPAGHQPNMYQNGQGYYHPEQYQAYQNQGYVDPARGIPSHPSNAPFRLHSEGPPGVADNRIPYNSLQSTAQSSPNHPVQPKSPSPPRQVVTHAPVAAPPPDDMEPQKVDFIESDGKESRHEQDASDKLKRLSISSGSRTYRISHDQGSPTRPAIGTKTYRVPTKKGLPVHDDVDLPQPPVKERSMSPPPYQPPQVEETGLTSEPLQEGAKADKGFYITFEDDSTPKRPKPQLRARKMSQRKPSTPTTPMSTPSREEPPPVPERSRRSTRASVDKSSSDSPSLQRNGNRSVNSPSAYSSSVSKFPYRSDTAITPSSSASSISPSVNLRETHWSPQTPHTYSNNRHSLINNNDNKIHNYNRFYDRHESDDGSDLTDDGTKMVPVVRTRGDGAAGVALVIENELVNEDSALSEMDKKKERLMMMSMRRKQQQEETKRKKEIEAELKREEDKVEIDKKQRKKDEEKARREMILERHKIKKAIEEAEKEGRYYNPPAWYYDDSSGTATPSSKSSSVRLRPGRAGGKPRPKTLHEASYSETDSSRRPSNRGQRGSSQNIAESPNESTYLRKTGRRWGSSNSLSRATGTRGSTGSLRQDAISSSLSRPIERTVAGKRSTSILGEAQHRDRTKPSMYGSRDAGMDRDRSMYEVHEVRRPSLAVDSPRVGPRHRSGSSYGYGRTTGIPGSRKYRSTGNLYGTDQDSLLYHMSEDSGLGRATPPRRAPSPGMSSRHFPSPSGPGSLPPGLFSRRRPGVYDDNASDISVTSSNMDYCGPRLFKQPTSKSNRPIILNAVEYCVFPGVVNQTSKQRVMEEIARSEAKHFLVLFRDAGCQYRAIYSYNPETEEVLKIYGTGPKLVTDRMFETFFKYNSGGKCFSQIHTKHLTVTIDAFTIHNSLWQGKKVNLPSKRDMKLVI